MSTRYATVTSANAANAAQIIRTWHDGSHAGALDQFLASFASQAPAKRRLQVSVDGTTAVLEPSGFEFDDVVLVFHRPPCQGLRAVFFDLRTNSFLSAVANLSIPERGKLGGRRRQRDEFLRSLITTARSTRVPVGS